MTEWTAKQQAEHRKLWVEALRSGKYQQGTNWLRNQGSYCCLGVACDISGLGRWRGEEESRFTYSGAKAEQQYLPKKVCDWLGLTDNEGSFDGPFGNSLSLIGLNDNGKSFSYIADIIESEPKGLIASPITTKQKA